MPFAPHVHRWLTSLRQEVQRAREELSCSSSVPIVLNGHCVATLTAVQLKRVLDVNFIPHVQRLIDDILWEAELPNCAIDRVVLTGELAEMPGLANTLGFRFDRDIIQVISSRVGAIAQGGEVSLTPLMGGTIYSYKFK